VFEAGNIREWRGHDVVDAQDHKIGELEAVYVDTGTDLPSFGTVKVGLPTRHRLVFVPLDQATVGPGYVKGGYDKKQVKVRVAAAFSWARKEPSSAMVVISGAGNTTVVFLSTPISTRLCRLRSCSASG